MGWWIGSKGKTRSGRARRGATPLLRTAPAVRGRVRGPSHTSSRAQRPPWAAQPRDMRRACRLIQPRRPRSATPRPITKHFVAAHGIAGHAPWPDPGRDRGRLALGGNAGFQPATFASLSPHCRPNLTTSDPLRPKASRARLASSAFQPPPPRIPSPPSPTAAYNHIYPCAAIYASWPRWLRVWWAASRAAKGNANYLQAL